MTETEIFEKYGLEDEIVPDRIISVELPYAYEATIKHYTHGWRYSVRDQEAMPGRASGQFGPAESLEDAVMKVRRFVYGDEAEKDEPSLWYLWKHHFTMDDYDSDLFTSPCLRVRSKWFKDKNGDCKKVWRCQAIIDGQMSKMTDSLSARNAVEGVCEIYGIELPAEVKE